MVETLPQPRTIDAGILAGDPPLFPLPCAGRKVGPQPWHWAWAYAATFAVSLLPGSVLGLIAAMLTARMATLTAHAAEFPPAAYLTGALVTLAIEAAALYETCRCHRTRSKPPFAA